MYLNTHLEASMKYHSRGMLIAPRVYNMESDLAQSDIAFRAQFDRGNADYHRGDPRPVPIGGSRVPDSMPSEYAAEQTEERPPSEECALMIEARAALLEFKKVLSQLCPCVDALQKARSLKDESKKTAAVNERTQNLMENLEKLRISKQTLQKYGNKIPNHDLEIAEIENEAPREFNREEYVDYTTKVKRFSQVVFRETQDMLKAIKDLKKS